MSCFYHFVAFIALAAGVLYGYPAFCLLKRFGVWKRYKTRAN
jgi:hypothetical protein